MEYPCVESPTCSMPNVLEMTCTTRAQCSLSPQHRDQGHGYGGVVPLAQPHMIGFPQKMGQGSFAFFDARGGLSSCRAMHVKSMHEGSAQTDNVSRSRKTLVLHGCMQSLYTLHRLRDMSRGRMQSSTSCCISPNELVAAAKSALRLRGSDATATCKALCQQLSLHMGARHSASMVFSGFSLT